MNEIDRAACAGRRVGQARSAVTHRSRFLMPVARQRGTVGQRRFEAHQLVLQRENLVMVRQG
jgi:hypothetical protein